VKDYDIRTLTQVAAATGGSYLGGVLLRRVLGGALSAATGAVGAFLIVSVAMDLLDRRRGLY
jgi:hypothetical protein